MHTGPSPVPLAAHDAPPLSEAGILSRLEIAVSIHITHSLKHFTQIICTPNNNDKPTAAGFA